MTEREVTLLEVLDRREARAERQQELLKQYQSPLICFTMNIPGPVKNSDLIRAGFRLGCQLLTDLLSSRRLPLLHREEVDLVTGCEGFFVVEGDAAPIKALCVELEDHTAPGRLFDLDVLTPAGEKLERTGQPRKCLICDQPARVCGPVRAHSAAQLQAKAREILEHAVFDHHAQTIAARAVQALLYEVCVTPKPGLVDRANSGSHEDMEIYTFLTSAPALQPYFVQCARLGMEYRESEPQALFSRLRLPGQLAEQTMFRATNGVNTHKGAIFTLGLACAAAGMLVFSQQSGPEEILARCAELTRGLTARELGGLSSGEARTAGERLFVQYGITGIRGQAEQGFPAVLSHGLPRLREGLARGYDFDRAGWSALLALLTAADDTNLITRGGMDTALRVRTRLTELIARDPFPDLQTVQALEHEFVQSRLSPGGSADLLALSFFLLFTESDS